MKRYLIIMLVVSLCKIDTGWSQVTFENVSNIIYNKCSVCHRAGEVGPMSLTTYEEVSQWANTIKEVTAIRYMPPWKPDPSYSRFLDETHLEDEDIQLIADWVDGGILRGDPSKEAAFPEFPEGSALGEPDLVLSFAESYTHKGNNDDEYRWFVLPTGLTEDKIVKAVEFRPGNRQIVHHSLVFEDTKGIARAQDEKTEEYGYQGFGSFAGGESSNLELLTAKQFQGYTPGSRARFYPDGIGQVLKAGADLAVQLHYAPWPKDEIDSSTVNIFFADDSEQINRSIQSHIMVPLPGVLVNRNFFILPEEEIEFHGIWDVPKDISLVGIAPHMHLLGKDWTVYIERPDGSIENLIHIPDWDFNWQGSYYFPKYKIAPQGSKIHAFASYDNRSSNPNNPNSPPQIVSWGERTTDEMYYLPLLYTDYQSGDEDISFGSVTTSTEEISAESIGQLLPISPNPVLDYMFVEFDLRRGLAVSIRIVDQDGKLVRVIREGEFYSKGKHAINIQTNTLHSGAYYIQLVGNKLFDIKSFIKMD